MDLRRMLGSQDNIRIMAYAGIGKTTTLVEMCRRHPAIRFLLVVFNKSLQLHSKKVFPPNVTVKTTPCPISLSRRHQATTQTLSTSTTSLLGWRCARASASTTTVKRRRWEWSTSLTTLTSGSQAGNMIKKHYSQR